MIEVLQQIETETLEKDARSYVGISGGSISGAMIQALERLYRNAGRKPGVKELPIVGEARALR